MSKSQWTIQAPWGVIYKIHDLRRFMADRPQLFPDGPQDYASAVFCADTIAGRKTEDKKCSFLFAGGWRVLDQSELHEEIVSANVKPILRYTWLSLRSPEGKLYTVGDIQEFGKRMGLDIDVMYSRSRSSLLYKIAKRDFPCSLGSGWTIERALEMKDFRVVTDPMTVHYTILTKSLKLPKRKKQKQPEWTICDAYGYVYRTKNLYRFMRERPHVFPNLYGAYKGFCGIIRERCQAMEGTFAISNGWTALDRDDVHDLVYNWPPKASPCTPGKCEICGRALEHGRVKYCSDECYKKSRLLRVRQQTARPRTKVNGRSIRICSDCGREFFNTGKCKRCTACRIVARSKQIMEHRKSGIKRTIGSVDICPVCGKEYTVTSPLQKYCSPECSKIGGKERSEERKRSYAAHHQESVTVRTCAACGKEFSTKTTAIYCSEECRKIGKQKRKSELKKEKRMSEETRNFDLSAEVAYALAVLPSAHSAIMRVYNRDRAKYYALARQSDNRNHPALFCGRAEHQIMAQRVLGISASGEVENLCMIFRSVNRRMYDELIQCKGSEERITLDPFLRHIPSTASALTMYAQTIVAMATCAVNGIKVEQSPIIDMAVHSVEQRIQAAAYRKQPSRNEAAIARMREHLGADRFAGFGACYDASADRNERFWERIALVLNSEGIDPEQYTSDVVLTPLDATLIAGDTPEESMACATLLLLARSIRLDRDFTMSLYREDKVIEVEAAHKEAEQAKQEAEALRQRIKALEDALRDAEKARDAAKAEADSHQGDAAELAALRDAVYQSAQEQEPVKQVERPERDLSKLDVVIVGGHPGWARQIKEQLPVRAWPHGTTCPASVLASADEVWIQAAYMAHKEFYAIINAVRRAGTTVRYFATTGVGKCVEQLKAMS